MIDVIQLSEIELLYAESELLQPDMDSEALKRCLVHIRAARQQLNDLSVRLEERHSATHPKDASHRC